MIILAKIGLFGMFLNYYPFNIMFGHFIPSGTYAFFAMVVFGVVGDAIVNNRGKIAIDIENWYWVLYLIASLATSIFAVSTSVAVSSLVKYAMRLFIIIAIVYVCKKEQSIKFSVDLLAVTAILSAITAFIQMSGIHGRLKLDSGASISVNDFGSIMAYGCFAVIPFFRYMNWKSDFWKTALTIASTVVILMELFIAGSRKSFYAVLLLYALMLLFVWLKTKMSVGKVLTLIVLGIIVVVIINQYLLPNLEETSLYQRIWGYKVTESESSNDGRVDLYKWALQDFISSPICGLEFDNYYLSHWTYSHSTYAEPLACSGLLSILYFIPLVKIFKNQWHMARFERMNRPKYYIETELLIFYIVFLFVGVGIPYMYKDIPCIVFGMMIAHHHIENDVKLYELRENYER